MAGAALVAGCQSLPETTSQGTVSVGFDVVQSLTTEAGARLAGSEKTETSGGADIKPLKALGVPIIAISQDGTTYFDLHRTPSDTLDRVDPAALDATIDAYALAAEMIANG